jgi:hypothetical protein
MAIPLEDWLDRHVADPKVADHFRTWLPSHFDARLGDFTRQPDEIYDHYWVKFVQETET